MSAALVRLARAGLPAATVVAALLAVVPAGPEPFGGPKRAVLVAAAAAALALLPWSARRPSLLLALPVASVALSSLLGPYAAPPAAWTALGGAVLLFAWPASGVARAAAVPAAVAAGVVAAAVALAQAAGWDPFAAWAPHAGGRLEVYGTLGNPDFVASALTVVLALALGELGMARRRLVWAAAAILLLLALAATRSFATLVAASLGALAAIFHLSHHGRRPGKLALLAVAAGLTLLAVPLAGRSAVAAMQGRGYLVNVAWRHAFDAPLTGFGPGAVERLWPAWELELWQARCGDDPACVELHREHRFTGRQDHLHSDGLEVLLERGLPGVLALLVVLWVGLRAALAAPGPRGAALVGGLTAFAARASFDFPLARPADLVLLALLVALATTPEEP